MKLCYAFERAEARGHGVYRRVGGNKSSPGEQGAPYLACWMNSVAFSVYFCTRLLKFTGCSTMLRFS